MSLTAALAYARHGIPVLPVHTPAPGGGCSCDRGPHCDSPGKHPRLRHGLHDASTDPRLIEQWWTRWPDANIGLRTGVAMDVADVDSDPGRHGLLHLFGGELPPGPRVRTGGGGWHYWFRSTGLGNRVHLVPGLDWRGAGGYVVAPPSRHVRGDYRWLRRPGDTLPSISAALRALLDGPAWRAGFDDPAAAFPGDHAPPDFHGGHAPPDFRGNHTPPDFHGGSASWDFHGGTASPAFAAGSASAAFPGGSPPAGLPGKTAPAGFPGGTASPTSDDRFASPTFHDRFTSPTSHDRFASPTSHDRFASPAFHDRFTSQAFHGTSASAVHAAGSASPAPGGRAAGHPDRHTPGSPAPIVHPDRYARAALTSEASRVARAPVGTRNDTLNRAAFALGRLVGAGLLDAATASRELEEAALFCGLGRAEIRRTIRSGLNAGRRTPFPWPGTGIA